MASDLLHIKDGYFFEVPKGVWPSNRKSAKDFPDWFVRNDPDFQSHEADHLIQELVEIGVDPVNVAGLKQRWESWKASSDTNYGYSLDDYLELELRQTEAKAKTWAKEHKSKAADPLKAYIAETSGDGLDWFYNLKRDPESNRKWQDLRDLVNTHEYVNEYKDTHGEKWDQHKLAQYNDAMSGKIMIPQIAGGTLRNAYQPESGFCISRYMVIEVIVAVLLLAIFSWLARRLSTGENPKGKAWNMVESSVMWVRNEIVVPAMGEHDADRFMPFFYSLFFFILGCNLMGMVPYIGAPTAAFATTFALAFLVFIFGMFLGIKQFGVVGYLKNISPSLGLPWYLAIVIVPMLWIIEAASLLIKHLVLAARLLLNMSAGHLVMLGILGIGISVEAASMNTFAWSGVAAISVIGTTLLSFLELFVAGLQAFVFTFLAAFLIGSSIHHH
jgi:F-type H+-transporting ATPase subunit a